MKLLGSITSASTGGWRSRTTQHPRYQFVEANCKDVSLLKELLSDCDHFVASAAMIGGISYFHEFAYDLLAENERITAASFDAAIHAHQHQKLQKITVMSSSMVFESTSEYPTPEGARASLSSAAFDVRISEAGDRVFCSGRVGAVQAALHHCASV